MQTHQKAQCTTESKDTVYVTWKHIQNVIWKHIKRHCVQLNQKAPCTWHENISKDTMNYWIKRHCVHDVKIYQQTCFVLNKNIVDYWIRRHCTVYVTWKKKNDSVYYWIKRHCVYDVKKYQQTYFCLNKNTVDYWIRRHCDHAMKKNKFLFSFDIKRLCGHDACLQRSCAVQTDQCALSGRPYDLGWQRSGTVSWVLRDKSGAHHPVGPVMKLGIGPPRKKKRNMRLFKKYTCK